MSIRTSECVPLLRMILLFQFAKKCNGRRIASTRQNVYIAQIGAGLFLRRTARWGTIFHAAQSRQCSHGVHVFQIGYEKRATHLIQSGNQSPAIMDRMVLSIRELERKKIYYESILKQELHEVDEQYTSLRYLSDELQIRARSIQAQKRLAA